MSASEIKRRVTEGTSRRGESVWVVTGVSTISEALGDANLNNPVTGAPIGGKFPGIPTLRATEHSAEQIDRAKPGQGYEVTVRYEPSTGPDWQQPGPNDPGDPGFLEINVETSAKPYDVWRVGDPEATDWDVDATPSAAEAGGVLLDIGGVKIDSGGEQVSTVRVFSTLRVSKTLNAEPDYLEIRNHTGTRNSSVYAGAAIGSLLYQGGNSRRIGVSTYIVDHTFHWDDWYHLVQVPDRDANGIIQLDLQNHAEPVFWRQSFPLKTDFFALGI